MRKTIKELTTQDDFMFGKVFEDIELAKELIDPAFPELHMDKYPY